MLLIVVLIAVCIFGPFICKAEDKAKAAAEQRATQARFEASQEAQRQKAAFAAAQAEARAAEAAARKTEQQRKKAEREAEQQRKRAEREAEQKRKQDEKLEAARQLAEYRERALQAEKELKALQAGSPAQEKPQAPKPVPAPAHVPESAPVQPAAENAAKSFPQTFTGEVVAFTGTLPTMTRKEAIQATKDRGGRAYETINSRCTLLVIGQRPGRQQQDRAESWNVPTITWEEWFQRAEISWRRRQYMKALASELKAS